MSPTIRRTFTSLLALAASAAVPASASAPVGVSPGELERVAPVEHRCPTFSWTETEGAVGYQLVAYALPADPLAEVVLSSETQVLGRRLPPRATSWTPAADLCFAPGGAYVWFLRAVLEERDGEIVDASEWSEGLHFGLPRAAEGDDADATAGDRRRDRPGASTRVDGANAATAGKSARSVVTAAAAIRGDSVDSTGEVHGVIGATASASGAGLAAVNTAGGPDLILDGAAQGLADTRFSESGVDRSSASNQVFTIANSGAGAVTLAVDGAITGDGAGLTGLDAGNLATGALPSARLTGTYSSAVSLSNSHNVLAGNGAGLINLNASSLASGTLPSARLAGAYANALTLSNPGNLFTGDGSGLTNVNATTVGGIAPSALLPGTSWGLYDATVVDAAECSGSISIAIGADGLGIIAYTSDYDLTVAHCENLLCSTVTSSTLDTYSLSPAVTIGGDGLPLISYWGPPNDTLKVAHCSDPACSTATLSTPDLGNRGLLSSIATGQDGYGIISYWDPDLGALKVAHCTNATCSSSVISIVDEPSTGSAGRSSGVTIGADGLPLVVYTVDQTSGPDALKAAHCADAHCSSATLSTIVSGTSPDSCAVTVGSDGLVLISYIESGFHVAHCDNLLCTSATAVVVDATVGALGHYFGTSIRIGSDGRALASYYHDGDGNLKVAHCSNDLCSSATTVDAKISGDVGKFSSLTIGADGLPLVAYCHEDSGSVLVTHCSNRFCVPKARM